MVRGLVVQSAFVHRGPARLLVHRLKYEGLAGAAEPLAVRMAELLPADATGLVPIPRSLVRRVRYGIDPAHELARRLAFVTGLPVIRGLRAPLAARRHAGKSRTLRTSPRLSADRPVGRGAVLIDDVVTTGSTLEAAVDALGAAGGRVPRAAATGTFSGVLN